VKKYDDMLSRFHLIPERNGQTDRLTDLLYQYSASVCVKEYTIRAILNDLLYSNTVIGTLPYDGWSVTFRTAGRGGGQRCRAAAPHSPLLTV